MGGWWCGAGRQTEIWERTLGTNLMGPFYMTRAVVPELIKRGGGEVVMTSSVAGLTRDQAARVCDYPN